jgi:hypothetical protein
MPPSIYALNIDFALVRPESMQKKAIVNQVIIYSDLAAG